MDDSDLVDARGRVLIKDAMFCYSRGNGGVERGLYDYVPLCTEAILSFVIIQYHFPTMQFGVSRGHACATYGYNNKAVHDPWRTMLRV